MTILILISEIDVFCFLINNSKILFTKNVKWLIKVNMAVVLLNDVGYAMKPDILKFNEIQTYLSKKI